MSEPRRRCGRRASLARSSTAAAGLTFTWNGKPYSGYAGDTIVSALAAAGERVFSRSMKYHRPRGLLTASFHDPGCMVQVGDEPNVRGAHRLVDRRRWWSAPRTPGRRCASTSRAANRFAGRFLTAGFYYKTFMRPQRRCGRPTRACCAGS